MIDGFAEVRFAQTHEVFLCLKVADPLLMVHYPWPPPRWNALNAPEGIK